ncbi:MAG: beta-propeller domain-containing protein, partial [Deltaproteobacteria bacterium]|nr:beta-propeller domain-containing protein [Deltaproteobacteria bacterium]
MTRNWTWAALVGSMALCAAGCKESDAEAPRLREVTSCSELEQAVRAEALATMHEMLDSSLALALEHDTGDECLRIQQLGGGCGCGGGSILINNTDTGDEVEVSGTNNQVPGVEEADFVKSDERYLYVVSGGQLQIVEAWPASSARVVSRTPLEGVPLKLLVTENRALVYASDPGPEAQEAGGVVDECTYGYACAFTGDGNPTIATVFDITDRSAPRKVREIRFSGSLVAARQVGSAVYSVVSDAPLELELDHFPPDLKTCERSSIIDAFGRLRAANVKEIAAMTAGDMLSIRDRILDGSAPERDVVAGCPAFYRSGVGDGEQLTTVAGLDMGGSAPVRSSTVISRPGAVYASADALYFAVPHDQWRSSVSGSKQASTVHKFGLDPGTADVRYLASGLVKGRVLNQFSMDEHRGYLRIATTSGRVGDQDVHSTLSVMAQRAGRLAVQAKLDRIAAGADIRSVRFDGER